MYTIYNQIKNKLSRWSFAVKKMLNNKNRSVLTLTKLVLSALATLELSFSYTMSTSSSSITSLLVSPSNSSFLFHFSNLLLHKNILCVHPNTCSISARHDESGDMHFDCLCGQGVVVPASGVPLAVDTGGTPVFDSTP